jgi:hypothetical protein
MKDGGGNDGLRTTKENQKQVSLRCPQPLEIAVRFPHSHRRDDYDFDFFTKFRKEARRRSFAPPPGSSFD